MITLRRLVDRLRSTYGDPVPPLATDPFGVVLYENIAYLATDERRGKAFRELQRRIGVTPQAIARASLTALRAIAANGGVYPDLRASRMRESARIVIEDFGGDIAGVLNEPVGRRRRLLKKFPAIGDPGVDKILLFSRTEPVLALESNGLRALLRIGFGSESKNYATSYKSVQRALGTFHPRDFDLLIDAHVLLARHGREICKRTAPLCELCALQRDCAYYRRPS
jgi:endonuclease-3 related protein